MPRSNKKVKSSHKRKSHKRSSNKRRPSKRRSARKVTSSKKRRSARRKSMKGGDLDLFKSLVTNPLSKSSHLISNLKDHNVLVDRFDDMKNQISKLTKRIEQLESALSKLQK